MPRHITLSEQESKDLGMSVTDMWREDNLDRNQWLNDLQKWLDAYQGRPQPRVEPWDGASNLFVPVTATVQDAIHPKLMAALFRPTPIASFKPQEPSDIERVHKWERFLDYVVREEVNAFPVADRIVAGTLQNGIQVVKISWALETKKRRVRHSFDPMLDPVEAINAILRGEQAYAEAITRVTDEEYEVVMKGRKVKIEAERTPKELLVYVDREEVVKDCPEVEVLNPEDVSFNSDCPYDLQKADHIVHRYWLTIDQIKKNARIKLFDLSDDELEELETIASGDIAGDDETSTVKDFREDVTGASETYREGSPYDKVELLDAYIKYDIDDDGYDEDVVVTVPRQAEHIILRCMRLEDVYRHGMRPFVLYYLNPISNTVWAQGIPQMLEGLQQEINVIHNQRVDSGTIANTPFWWYQPSAGLKAEETQVRPGVGLPVQDVNQIKLHTPANFTAWGFQEEAVAHTYVEKRTKVSDITLGRIGEVQGAARTATGVQALNQQQAQGFDIYIRRIQEGWKQMLQQILALYREYMPPGRLVRITGSFSDPPLVVSKADLKGNMDMIFTGNSLSTDQEIERNTTTFLAQTVMSPQAMQFLLQLGGTTPQGIVEWYRHLLEVFDVSRMDRILTMPPMPKTRKPEDVMNSMLSGERVLPQQGEDHNAIIMLITQYLDSPDGVALLPEVVMLMQEQLKLRQTQLMQEQLQQMMMMATMQSMARMQGQMPFIPGQGGAPIALPAGGRGLTY